MSVGLYLRSFCGFALQMVPCAILLLLPFREEAFPKGKRKAYAWMAALSLVFSLCYPLSVWLNMGRAANSNLDDNLYMLAAIAVNTVLFFRITRENLMRKFSALFIVISYAAIQFFLANMLMDLLPLNKQDMIYNDATLVAYLIVTVLLLPPVVLFMRTKLRDYLELLGPTAHCRLELGFLMVVLVIYLVLNALYSALWIQLRDTLQLSFVYFIPFSLFLSVLLICVFYFTINLSIFRARSEEQAVELALMRQNYTHIEENIEQQKRAMHDTRQLLRNIGTLAKEGKREELLKYIDEAMDYTAISDKRFCPNSCVNGLLNYYAGLAEARNIDFSAQAVCGQLPFSNADITILLGNALDNAIRAASEFGEAVPDSKPEIRFSADIINNQFAIQIENSCLAVSFAAGFQKENRAGDEWLPADAFRSTHGGGYGLKRMEMIAGKYGGNAWFSFDAKKRIFVTRLMLPVSEV